MGNKGAKKSGSTELTPKRLYFLGNDIQPWTIDDVF